MENHVTRKQLAEMMHKGVTFDILLRRFELDEREKLFQAMQRITPGKVSEYWKTLEKREKDLKKALARKAKKEELQEEVQDSEAKVQEETQQIDPRDMEMCENEDTSNEANPVTEEVEEFSEINSLPALQNQAIELRNDIMNLEIGHKDLMQARRGIENELIKEKATLNRLQEELRNSKDRVLDLTQSYTELGIEMRKKSEEISVNKELLAEIQNQIVAAMKISVYVYENGSFDSDKKLPEVEVSVDQDLFGKLISMQEAEELTIKAIKALVVMVRRVEEVKQTTDNIEVCYETESLQSFCEKVADLLKTH